MTNKEWFDKYKGKKMKWYANDKVVIPTTLIDDKYFRDQNNELWDIALDYSTSGWSLHEDYVKLVEVQKLKDEIIILKGIIKAYQKLYEGNIDD